MFDGIFTYDEITDGELKRITFKNVMFLRSFGPWPEGYECDKLVLDFFNGILSEKEGKEVIANHTVTIL